MPEEEFNPNRKDITDLLIGDNVNDFDADDANENANSSVGNEVPEEPSEPHPITGIIDMLISSSLEPLEKHGYPKPNVSIWEEWGKPNLSKALYRYMPMDSQAGSAINSPAFAGLIGIGALAVAFLPVIMKFIEKKKEDEAIKAEEEKQIDEPKPAGKRTEPTPEIPVEKRKTIKTGDNAAEPKIVKLPGGGDDATPQIPMLDLIKQNMANGGEMTI